MDRRMLDLPRELTVLSQTGLTLVVINGHGHNPVRATGILLAHIDHICHHTRRNKPQIWDLSVAQKEHRKPGEYLSRMAQIRRCTVQSIMDAHKLPPDALKVRR